jgi:hypothetical protein
MFLRNVCAIESIGPGDESREEPRRAMQNLVSHFSTAGCDARAASARAHLCPDPRPAVPNADTMALEERRVTPVGATKRVEMDVRLVAAANWPLPRWSRRGGFRDDLSGPAPPEADSRKLSTFSVRNPGSGRRGFRGLATRSLRRLADAVGVAVGTVPRQRRRQTTAGQGGSRGGFGVTALDAGPRQARLFPGAASG